MQGWKNRATCLVARYVSEDDELNEKAVDYTRASLIVNDVRVAINDVAAEIRAMVQADIVDSQRKVNLLERQLVGALIEEACDLVCWKDIAGGYVEDSIEESENEE